MPDLQWKKLKEIVDQSDNIVFFGGAGAVSYTHLDVYKRQAQGHDVSDRESVRIKHMGKGKKD